MKLCPPALWEELALGDPTATFFQTPAWLRIAARHSGDDRGAARLPEIAPLLFELPGGPACLPLLRDRRWGRDRYFSALGAYAALLAPRALDAADLAAVDGTLSRLNLHLVSSPFARNRAAAGKSLPARTQVIDLHPGTAEDPARGWDPDPRRRLRIARENGLTVRPGSTAEDWDAYYALYQKSLRRWGARATRAYPKALFEALREEAGRNPGVRLWLSEHEGRAMGGYIALYHNAHACVWHGASDEAAFKLGSTQLLYHDMFADAARRGFAVFDLLGSAGLAPLEAFKASLGARTVEYASFLNRTGFVGALAALRERARASR
jgi:CelD/BcsL family acetyltransferase involved in cellulose biosynthesis